MFEPQSTNTLTYSEDFSQWSALGSPVLTTGQLAPDGTLGATKISGTIGTSLIYLNDQTSAFAARSIYAKTVSGTGTAKLMSNNANTNNLFTLTEDWQRFEINSSNAGGSNNFYVDFRDNTQTLSEFIIWGAQSEELTYATSYIPTEGATVTRNQDLCTNGGSLASINSTEGTLYGEIAALADGVNGRYISIGDGTLSNYVYFRITGVLNQIKMGVIKGGLTQASKEFVVSDLTQFNKLALSYSQDLFKFYVNGALIFTDTNGDIFPVGTLNTLTFNNANTANYFLGKTKALAVWKEALSDQELADLTYPTPTDPTFALDFDTIATDFTFARGSEATYVDAQGLIKSTNEIGPELVTNGDFATDSDWNKSSNVTIQDSSAIFTLAPSGQQLAQSINPTIGKQYKIVYEIKSITQGAFDVSVGSDVSTSYNNSVGVYTEYLTATSTNAFYIRSRGVTSGSIDNVSVKEYITETNTPRLDYSTGAEAFLLEPQSTNLITYSELF